MAVGTEFGDPVAVRSLATRLRTVADATASLAAAVAARAEDVDFEGRAAKRFRERANERRSGAQKVAGELHDLSGHLLRSAGLIEERIAATRDDRQAP